MTDYVAFPKPKSLVKLTGTINKLTVERTVANFVDTPETDALGEKLSGIGAILGALAGSGGAAMTAASHNQGDNEDADYITFELDGKVFKGWVKYFPFTDGEQVEVVADDKGDYWMVYAIARPADHMLAIFPHCKRSKSKHIRAMVKLWLVWGCVMILLIAAPLQYSTRGVDGILSQDMLFFSAGIMAVSGIFFVAVIYKYMRFSRLAEKIFQTLGLSNPKRIDLRKTSKRQRAEADKKWLGAGKEYGMDYFKY